MGRRGPGVVALVCVLASVAGAQTPPTPAGGATPPAADGTAPAAIPAAPAPPPPPPPGPTEGVLKLLNVRSLTLGGEVRSRGEWRRPASYAPTATDNATDFTQLRVRLFADADINANLRARIELLDNRVWGAEVDKATPATTPTTSADSRNLDLHQGFFEIRPMDGVPLQATIGRFGAPTWGDGRLLSPAQFSQVPRAFDGVYATWTPSCGAVQVLAANIREPHVLGGGDEDNDHLLVAGQASCRAIPGAELDLYLFGRELGTKSFASEQNAARLRRRRDLTFGLRGAGKGSAAGWTAEVVGQVGSQAHDAVRAWACAATCFGALPGVAGAPRADLEYAYSSGDARPTDGRVGTFDPLYPFGHAYLGHFDAVGWRNVHAGKAALRAEVAKGWTVHADGHGFWLASRRDAWFLASGAVARRDASGSSRRFLGAELDCYVKGTLYERLAVWVGWSHFKPGGFVSDTPGGHLAGDWVFAQAGATF